MTNDQIQDQHASKQPKPILLEAADQVIKAVKNYNDAFVVSLLFTFGAMYFIGSAHGIIGISIIGILGLGFFAIYTYCRLRLHARKNARVHGECAEDRLPAPK